MDKGLRVLDANLNRLREGLRVIEDTVRFICGDRETTLALKEARHVLQGLAGELPGGPAALLAARDSGGDVGAGLNTGSEMTRRTYGEILAANFKRTQEAARVLEEYAKIISPGRAARIKTIRFMLYELEKQIGLDFDRAGQKQEVFYLSKLKVLFHINEAERWPRVLLNITNFVKDVGGDNADIEVVANGAAVMAYVKADAGEDKEKLPADMAGLAGAGVKFAACRNALQMHALDEKALPPFVTVVSAGITAIARRQAAGYAYIKP